ncbi:MAG: radical SAM protein [Chloroflexi bacterium]|nr:radical SAM protein [Chloroflexota bacterium]
MIVLINPPGAPGYTANREGSGGLGVLEPGAGGFCYPPLTLAYAAAVLQAAGLPMQVVDAVGEGLDMGAAVQRVDDRAALCVVQASWGTRSADAGFLQALRADRPGVRVLLLAAALEQWDDGRLTSLADAWLLGEGEWATALAAQAVVDGARGALTPAALGLPGCSADGRRLDLAGLPRPAWDLLPWAGYPFLTALGSRGCPDACTYCPYVVGQGRRFRPRPPAEVAEELVWLARRFGPRRVILRDPVWARDGERAAEIADRLARADVGLAWECESRPEHLADRALLRLLRRAGCTSVKVGVESTDGPLLARLRRVAPGGETAYLEAVQAAHDAGRRAGLAVRPFVLVGLPGQTRKSVQETARFVEGLRPAALHVKLWVAYPGTPLWAERGAAPGAAEVAEAQQCLRGVPLARLPRPAAWRRLGAALRRRLAGRVGEP